MIGANPAVALFALQPSPPTSCKGRSLRRRQGSMRPPVILFDRARRQTRPIPGIALAAAALASGGPTELPSQVRRVLVGQNRLLKSPGPLGLGDPSHQARDFCHSFGQGTTLGLGPVDEPQGPPDIPAAQYRHADERPPDRAAHPPLAAVAARLRSLAHAGQSRTPRRPSISGSSPM